MAPVEPIDRSTGAIPAAQAQKLANTPDLVQEITATWYFGYPPAERE